LSSAATGELNNEAGCWRDDGAALQIAGHADSRGTIDYNLALGQRRANAVRAHLSGAGVPLHRMKTVSYGEEAPANRGGDEAAWAANRRVEVGVQ
jgi:peptidoglycan-associated lipoprotein